MEPDPRRVSPGSLLALVGFVGLCLLVGLVASAFTQSEVRSWYAALAAPPGKPPNWAFPVVWTGLYVAMAVAAWRVWRRAGIARRAHYRALRLWGWQLLVNALWTPVFFGMHALLAGALVIAALGLLVALTLLAFSRLDRLAAWLLAPYLAWVGYAAYLNAGFWWLNRG